MIKTEIKLLDVISEHFEEEIIKSLEIKKDSIYKAFEELIEIDAKKYQLVSENSIHRTEYVKIISRVKNKNSFREKLIRKNLGLKLISDLKLTEDNFTQNKGLVSTEIEKFDDIIGLRIVCDLNKDCPKALELIKNNLTFLKERKITFSHGEVESQPQKMKNGLNIYRLKGFYDDRIGFELQIKSKIDEAWGELDHFIFYKDYSFFPTKDAVQQTMNNVGKLLDEIENLLYDLRNSKDHYNKNLEKSIFLDKIEKTFSISLKKILGYPYQLERLSMLIKYLIDKEKSDILEQNIKQEMNFDFLGFITPKNHNLYIKSRTKSFELQLLEGIYMVIWEKKNKKLSQDNYSLFLDSFILNLKDYIIKEVIISDPLSDIDIKALNIEINFLVNYNVDEKVWISPQKYIDFRAIYSIVNDLTYENFEDEIEEGIIDEKELQAIKNIFLSHHFNCKLKDVILNEKLEKTQEIVFKLKDCLTRRKLENKNEETALKYTEYIANSF